MQQETKKKLKIAMQKILKASKIIVFFSFVYTSVVLYKLGATNESIIVAFSVAIYMIANRLDQDDNNG